MKVLIACEESQTVCKAFRALGHEAYSCDVQEPGKYHPSIRFNPTETVRSGQRRFTVSPPLWRRSGEVISDEMPMYERLPAQDW